MKPNEKRNIIIALVIGLVLGGGAGAYSASFLRLQSSNGQIINASNPLPVYVP